MVRMLLPLFCYFSLVAQERMIPHLTRAEGGFSTRILLENSAVEQTLFRLHSFDSTGNSLGTVIGSLQPGEVREADAAALLPSGASHLRIEGEGVVVSASYQSLSGATSPAHLPETSVRATRFRFFVGTWSEVFDGLALVNLGAHASEVWVAQRAADGSYLHSVRIAEQLLPNAKLLYVVGGPGGSSFVPQPGQFFEVYAQQPLALTALRGTVPGAPVGLLWGNHAQPMSQAEATRDGLGVFFIENGSLYDVFEAFGYNAARDRLAQADIYRRTARGRLAEYLGPSYLDQDIFARQSGYSSAELHDAFQNLSPDGKTALRAYVDGLNRHIGEVNANPLLMPAEYVLLGVGRVEPWTVEDCLAWLATLQRNFDPNGYGAGQSRNASLMQNLVTKFPASATGMFEDLRFVNDPSAPTMVPEVVIKDHPSTAAPSLDFDVPWDLEAWADRFVGRLDRNRHLLESIHAFVKMGSYAWVVAPWRTTSGKAVLYSGPQMGFSVPSICFEASIRGGGLEVSGMSVPGVPGIIVGRTPHHAWSMQVGHAHTADLYIEAPGSLGTPHRIETIPVRGAPDHVLEVYRTQHGPVLELSPITAWKYAHWNYELRAVEVFLGLARTGSVGDFGHALSGLGVSQHFCYADRDGNIAYWMSGREPLRQPGDARFPQGLFAPATEWDAQQVRPLVHDVNPPGGFYGGWNNKARSDYDNPPGLAYGPAHRAQVILDALSPLETLSFEQIRDLAIDIAATDSFGGGGNSWHYVKDAFSAAVQSDPTEARQLALSLLQSWDGHFVDGGALRWVNGGDRADAWILQDRWIRKVLSRTFADELGDLDNANLFQTLLHGLDPSTSLPWHYNWFQNLSDAQAPQTETGIILASLDETLLELGTRPWGSGSRGEINFVHSMLGIGIWKTPFGSRSTYAQVVEMGSSGPSRIQSMFPLGQSGKVLLTGGAPVLDAHYLDMAPFFDAFQPRNFPLFPEPNP